MPCWSQIIGTKGDYIWEMGFFAKSDNPLENLYEINFNFDPPQAKFVDRNLQMDQTCASYCNEEGRLLIYSNGIHIADSTHQIIEHGDSVSFNNFFTIFKSAMQNGYPFSRTNIVLPLSNTNLVYLQSLVFFEPEVIVWFKDLICAEIDLSQNISGKVISKKTLLSGDFEAGSMNACRHANGRDWWILIQKNNSGEFFSYLLDPTGFNLKNEISFNIPYYPYYQLGLIFSPDGKKCVKMAGSDGALMFDFDRQTGQLSNMFDLKSKFQITGFADVSFSRSSRFLYAFNDDYVIQYDLIKPDSMSVVSSRDTIAKYDEAKYPYANFAMGNLAPDGKIYIASANSWNVLSVIDYPDRKGKACGFRYVGFVMPSFKRRGAIPNFPNYRLGPLDGSEADSLGIDNIPIAKFRVDNDSSFYNRREFIDLSFLEPTDWHWDFGDGSYSSEVSPVHWFPSNGVYKVCQTVSNSNGSNTFCRDVNIGPLSAGNLVKDYGLSINPIPCHDYLILNVKEKFAKSLSMNIADVSGVNVKSGKVHLENGFTTVDVRALIAGTYFMTLQDSEGSKSVLKFIKQ